MSCQHSWVFKIFLYLTEINWIKENICSKHVLISGLNIFILQLTSFDIVCIEYKESEI